MKIAKDLSDYNVQKTVNEDTFFNALKALSPELYVLIKLIINENINKAVFYKLARQLININNGTGYGAITILIENGQILFVNSLEKDKIAEPIINEK